MTTPDLQSLVLEILNSRKYRHLGIPPETVEDLLTQELGRSRGQKEAVKETRKKLHNIVAPYLGDPDFARAENELERAIRSQDEGEIKATCYNLLSEHASTRERMPILKQFYRQIFAVTGEPEVILDLACGLNPLSFPWMGLPTSVRYYAYDLNRPRLALIHKFFSLLGMPVCGAARDILLTPPAEAAHVAFFFKEAHRFEQRQKGCNLAFWQALNVHYLLVSLPTASLSGRHNLLDQQRRLVYGTCQGQPWKISEILFDSEIVFCIDKTGTAG
jgi:16S rRNA (guanine(1405)-N(7))-methyltransferase